MKTNQQVRHSIQLLISSVELETTVAVLRKLFNEANLANWTNESDTCDTKQLELNLFCFSKTNRTIYITHNNID